MSTALIVGWPDEVAEDIGLGRADAVAVLSHDPKFDEPAITEALRRECRYVGAIGSRKTQRARRARLLDRGLSAEQLERLRGPIGLDLGGREPAETALAIMAEIVAARYGASARPMRELARRARRGPLTGLGGVVTRACGALDSDVLTTSHRPRESPAVSADSLRAQIREVPDFPKPGILFYDITTLLNDAEAFREAIELMNEPFKDEKVDIVVGMESRGFIFSAPMALHLGAGFVPVRKLGKLPSETISVEYELEYGTNTLEVHRDAIRPNQRVLIVDDLLATGGTVLGTIDLVKQLKGEIVGLSFLVELGFLKGRERLDGYRIHSVIGY